ncbi:peptidoglycan-binding protein [Candidatus Nomurabacteria bacterium]|nr:peptidoglycan-binding protein [Candidatus Nomurabacteria bacterium]
MNKLFKSKFLLGVMVAMVMFVGVATVASAATDCGTTTLKFGMRSSGVTCLQTALGVTPATGYFGKLTKAAVMAFQTANGLKADGIAGKMTLGKVAGTTTPTPNPTPTPTGPLSVMLSTDNPAAGTVLSSQALADLAHFTFTGSGTLSNVTLQRTGLSTSADISSVYLFDGNMRLTDGASVNTNGQIVFSGLNIAVNGSKTLSVKVDMASPVSSVSLGVTLTSYMVTGSTTANTANVAANVFYVSAIPSNSSQIALGANTVPVATINAGSPGYTVWSAPLTVSGRSAFLKGANFRVVGSAPIDAVQNIKLYVDGTAIGSATTVGSNNYAFFDFGSNPLSLNTGTHTIDVRGDVQKGSNRDFTFSIQNAADLMVTDSQLGINIAACSGTCPTAFASNTAGKISVSYGSVTANVDPAFQLMSNVTGGATNTAIAKFKLHGYGEDVKIQTLTVTPTLSGQSAVTAAGLNNVTLFFNGSQVGSSTNMTSATTQALTFTLGSSLIVPAGVDSILEVRADLTTYSTNLNYSDGSITVALSTGSNNAQGMTSLYSVNVPATSVTTSGLTIQTGTLSVSKNTGYADYTLSPNATGAKIGSFVLQNQGTSESIRVTNLAVTLSLTTAASTNYANLRTSETSGSGSTPINPATAAAGQDSVNNFSVNFELAPGATKTVDVFADIGSTTGSPTVIAKLKPTAVGTSSSVTLTPSAFTTGQTITMSSGTFGSPTFTASSSTVAQYVAANGGATDAVKQTFKFSATNGTATVSELKFVTRGTAGTVGSIRVGSLTAPVVTPAATTLSAAITTTTATSVSVTSAAGMDVGSVFLVDSEEMLVTAVSGTTLTVTRGVNSTSAATHSNSAAVTTYGMAYLSGVNLTVPNGGSGLQTDVYVSYNHVGTNGVSSGSTSIIELTYRKYTIGGTTTSGAITPVASTTTMTLVGSKPTVTASKPTATLAAAATEAIDVTIAADSKGDISLDAFPITVALNAATVSTTSTSNISVVTSDGQTVSVSNSAFSATTGGSSTITFGSSYLIPAGTSKTFRVYVTPTAVTGTGVNGASMTTSLATGSAFSWTDVAGAGGSLTGTANIYNFPNTFSSTIYN